DLIKVGEGFGRFHLAQQTDVVLGLWQVVAYGPPACHPRDGGTHATDAVRRVTNRRHRPARFLGRLHHGHQQVARPDVQQALDLNRVVPGGTYDRRDRISGQRLQLEQGGLDGVRCVFAVDQAPVKPGGCADLAGDRVAQTQPDADLRRTL